LKIFSSLIPEKESIQTDPRCLDVSTGIAVNATVLQNPLLDISRDDE
jgi:hypothetical protein